MESGSRLKPACEILGISVRTFQRWRQDDGTIRKDGRKSANRPVPANKLSEEEERRILEACNEKRFQNLPPSQIVPTLMDEGVYIASTSSFYRVLHRAGQAKRRGRASVPSGKRPTSHAATAPNQVWSWDITYLKSPIAGQFFYLYLIMDIFSRKIVGWEIHSEESADHASVLIQKACLKNGISTEERPLVLHSDNGSPMKGSTMLATLHHLGIQPSYSRPRVSDDNPYSESLFRTLKYRPEYSTKPFEDLVEARRWTHRFATWYNEEHKHSSLNFVTPSQRHSGEDELILRRRETLMAQAKARHPDRWGKRHTRDWTLPDVVWLNPEKREVLPEPTPLAA